MPCEVNLFSTTKSYMFKGSRYYTLVLVEAMQEWKRSHVSRAQGYRRVFLTWPTPGSVDSMVERVAGYSSNTHVYYISILSSKIHFWFERSAADIREKGRRY